MVDTIKNIILVVLIIVIIVLIIKWLRKFKHPRIDTFNLVDGKNGSGKTASLVCRTIRLLRRNYFICRNFNLKNDYIILSNFPIGKLEKKSGKRYIKIYRHKIYCYDLDLDILLLQKLIPQDETIILIDEFDSIASQFEHQNPLVSNNIDEWARTLRHQSNSKAYCFCATQSLNNVFFQVRRRAGYDYNMISCSKVPLLPITKFEFRKILVSDTVSNIIETKDATQENDICKWIFFINPFKYYESCYLRHRYDCIDKFNKDELKSSQTLYRNDFMNVKYEAPKYYKSLINDGITEDKYNLMIGKDIKKK